MPAQLFWVLANAAIKLSILDFYNSLFGLKSAFRKTTYAVMILVMCICIGQVFQVFLFCRPFGKNWDPLLPGTCGSLNAELMSSGIINLFIDVAIVALPIPVVWRLQMARRNKITITIMFSLGIM